MSVSTTDHKMILVSVSAEAEMFVNTSSAGVGSVPGPHNGCPSPAVPVHALDVPPDSRALLETQRFCLTYQRA